MTRKQKGLSLKSDQQVGRPITYGTLTNAAEHAKSNLLTNKTSHLHKPEHLLILCETELPLVKTRMN